MVNQTWYWVGDETEMSMLPDHWHTGKPNGQDENEFCSDFIDKHVSYEINDAPCQSTDLIWKFVCEKLEHEEEKCQSEKKNQNSNNSHCSDCIIDRGCFDFRDKTLFIIIIIIY